MVLVILSLVMALAPLGSAQSVRPLAILEGVPLTEAEVRLAAVEDLERLEARRLQFEATHRAEEHEILEEALKGLIADRILIAEAESQDITVDELLAAEVAAKAPVADDEEVRNVYDLNQEQLSNVSQEVGLGRVREFLAQRSYDRTLEAYVSALREKYDVESFLGPYRVDVVSEGHPMRGPAEAPVTIVEFSDFECPYCRQTVPVLQRIREEYGNQVRLVYRQFPLNSIHPRAQKAAEASLCADDQGQFWSMHDALFLEPVELEAASLREKAAGVGLEMDDFNQCLDEGRNAERVEADIRAGVVAGVTGTPAIFVNGRPVTGGLPFDAFSAIIDEELAAAGGE